jgi:hypothetical protein
MAFHGDQPNMKQIDMSVETGVGYNPASGSLMFHNTSGLVQHINGDWADFTVSLALNDLTDVSVGGAVNGQILSYNGTTWVPVDHDMEAIADLDTTTNSPLTTSDLFIRSDGDGTYSFAALDLATNVSGDLGDLDDVNTAGHSSGQVIVSNGTTFAMETLALGTQVTGQLEDLTDVDSTTNSPTITANLGFISDGDGTYSFAAMDLSTNVGGDLGDLDNVTAVATTSGQVLMADGSNFIMKAITLGDEVTGQLEDLSDVDSTTNTPQSTADLALLSDGDGTYSFAAMDLSTNVGGDLGDLDNVTAVATTSGQVLMADGSNFIMKQIALGDEVTGQLEDLSDVDSTTNSPLSVADLSLVSDGDGTYSFKEIVSARRTVSSISASLTGVVQTIYLCDSSGGAFTVTAPAAHTAGDTILIKDSSGDSQTNAITIATADADTIDGAASDSLQSNFGAKELISDGTNWFIV